MGEITMINIKDLHPHPDNPRKSLGDLSELTESIRKNGIMQNLTVVEGHYKGKDHVPGGYTIVIGHRRCAAAHEAGIKELPCTVVEMDLQQQLCTMMEENMQRKDLTVAEQAYGFQYMFDLGVSVDEIAKRTGFAESTVKHRLEIAKLDKKTLHNAMLDEGWQLTIKDLIQLEQVKDIETRNEIVKKRSDSRNSFRLGIQNAVREEKQEAVKAKWMPLLEDAGAVPAPDGVSYWTSGYHRVKEMDLNNAKVPKKLTALKDYNKEKTLYWLESYGYLYLIQKDDKDQKEELTPAQAALKEQAAKKKRLGKLKEAAVKEIIAFIKEAYSDPVISPYSEEELIKRLWNLFRNTKAQIGYHGLSVLSEEKNSWNVKDEEKDKFVKELSEMEVSRQILIYLGGHWASSLHVVSYNGAYAKDSGKVAMTVYSTLNDLYGFLFSKPELLDVFNGTHELYLKEDDDEE